MATGRKRKPHVTAPPATTPEQRQAALDYLCRTSFPHFAMRLFKERYGFDFDLQPLHEAVWRLYHDIEHGDCLRACCSYPPRFGKTWTASAFVAYTMARYGDCKFIMVSYAERLSTEFSAQVQELLSLPLTQSLFPAEHVTIRNEKSSKELWETTSGNALRVCSPGAAITGFGAGGTAPPDPDTGKRRFQGMILVDDLLLGDNAFSKLEKDKAWNYFSNVVVSRRNSDYVPMLLIGQRLGPDDPLGHALAGELGGDPFRHLCIPAYDEENDCATWESRKSAKELREMRVANPWAYETMYQGRPYQRSGNLIPVETFVLLDRPAQLPEGTRYALGVDLAGSVGPKSDWSVCVLLAFVPDGRVVVVSVDRWRASIADTEERLLRNVLATPPGTVVQLAQDPGVAGKAWNEHLCKRLLPAGREVRSATAFTQGKDGSKAARIAPYSGYVGRGLVDVNPGKWRAEYIAELQQFDQGRFDDQVDATSSAFGAANHLLLSDGERKKLEEDERVKQSWAHFGDPDWQAVHDGLKFVRWERSARWLRRQAQAEYEAGAPARAQAEDDRRAALTQEEREREDGVASLVAATRERDAARRALHVCESRDALAREIARQNATRLDNRDERRIADGIDAMRHAGWTFIVRGERAVECRQPQDGMPKPWPNAALSQVFFASPHGQALAARYLTSPSSFSRDAAVAVDAGPSALTRYAREELARLEAVCAELEAAWGPLPPPEPVESVADMARRTGVSPAYGRKLKEDEAEAARVKAAQARRAPRTMGVHFNSDLWTGR